MSNYLTYYNQYEDTFTPKLNQTLSTYFDRTTNTFLPFEQGVEYCLYYAIAHSVRRVMTQMLINQSFVMAVPPPAVEITGGRLRVYGRRDIASTAQLRFAVENIAYNQAIYNGTIFDVKMYITCFHSYDEDTPMFTPALAFSTTLNLNTTSLITRWAIPEQFLNQFMQVTLEFRLNPSANDGFDFLVHSITSEKTIVSSTLSNLRDFVLKEFTLV